MVISVNATRMNGFDGEITVTIPDPPPGVTVTPGKMWSVAPAWGNFHYSIWDVTSLIGVGGIWLFFFIQELKGQTIIPIHETWVEEAIREGAVRVNA